MTCCVAACAPNPKISYDFPNVGPEPKSQSAAVDKNDRTGEPGVWQNEKDTKAGLSYRAHLLSIIKQLRVYWEKTNK